MLSRFYCDTASTYLEIDYFHSRSTVNICIAGPNCLAGYATVRNKDRPYDRLGGGVAVFCKNDGGLEEFSNPYECLWTKITTNDSIFYLSAIHLLDFLTDSCERLLSLEPNAKLIMAGDINQLGIKPLLNYHSLVQIVNVSTRGQKILDVFITNVPNF